MDLTTTWHVFSWISFQLERRGFKFEPPVNSIRAEQSVSGITFDTHTHFSSRSIGRPASSKFLYPPKKTFVHHLASILLCNGWVVFSVDRRKRWWPDDVTKTAEVSEEKCGKYDGNDAFLFVAYIEEALVKLCLHTCTVKPLRDCPECTWSHMWCADPWPWCNSSYWFA